MEAELFAAERCRSAQNGRALLCAAPYAREIQGSKASKNLPDARNRAPVPPFNRASSMRRLKGRSGESRGDRKPYVWCPVPFCPCRWAPTPPGRRRRPMSTLTSSVNLASSGEPLYRRKVCRLLMVKKKGAHRLRRAEVSRQLKKRLYSGRGLWYADNKCLQDFVGTDDRSAGLHHILSHYVEKRQMNVRSVFAALYTA